MKTTLEIPDDLYQQARVHAAHENRKIKDLVAEGLRLVLGLAKKRASGPVRRMKKAPVKIRGGHVIPALSNKELAELFERSGEYLP